MNTVHEPVDPDWWRTAVVYQIYPRSFVDSNARRHRRPGRCAQPVGLPRGPRDRRDLAHPVLPVPARRRRLRHQRLPRCRPHASARWPTSTTSPATPTTCGIKIIVDIVPNHTSDRHPWFQHALAAAPGSAARDRYIFRDGTGHTASNPRRTGDPTSGAAPGIGLPDGQWYFHLFAREQPDLNWDNEDVRDVLHPNAAVLGRPRRRRIPRRRGALAWPRTSPTRCAVRPIWISGCRSTAPTRCMTATKSM